MESGEREIEREQTKKGTDVWSKLGGKEWRYNGWVWISKWTYQAQTQLIKPRPTSSSPDPPHQSHTHLVKPIPRLWSPSYPGHQPSHTRVIKAHTHLIKAIPTSSSLYPGPWQPLILLNTDRFTLPLGTYWSQTHHLNHGRSLPVWL